MEKIKKIKGAQPPLPPLPPNNAGLEVIRVCKVYDWLVTSEAIQQDVTIPADVLALITTATAAGQSVSITCSAPTVPATVFPLAAGSCGSGNVPCNVGAAAAPAGACTSYPPYPYPPCPTSPTCRAVIVARNVPIPTSPGATGAIVKLIQSIPITFNVFIGTCPGTSVAACPVCPVATFICNVSARTQVVVCLPDLLDERNINCRAFNLTCNTSGCVFNGNTIDVEVSVCKEVQVEAEVKLEVNGKFAQPRAEIPIPPAAICPPVVEFPPQCSFYPVPNCTCQGEVAFNDPFATLTETLNGVTTTVAGTSTIRAAICPECNPAGSFVEYVFDPSNYTTGPFVVSFVSNAADPVGTPTCTTVGGVTTLVVGGTGVLVEGGITYNSVPFVLTLISTLGGCSYTLTINATVAAPTVPVIPGVPLKTTGTVTVPCAQLLIRNCTVLPINTVPPTPLF